MTDKTHILFEKLPCIKGNVFCPKIINSKESCPDCFSCQKCSQDRCNVCIGANKDE